MSRGDDVQAALEDGIANSLRHDEDFGQGAVIVGWVLVAEVLDPDGKRTLALNANKDSTAWQVKGYLLDALDYERQHGGAWRDSPEEDD